MSFVKESVSQKPIVDTVFTIVKKAKEDKAKSGEDVVVDAAARGAGVGERLVREALTLARREGAVKVLLTSNAARQAAHRLYERVGFVRYDTDVFRYEF